MSSTLPTLLAGLTLLVPAQEAAPRPDPALQDGLRRVLEAATPEAQRAALDFLRANAGPAHGRLVPQVFLFLEGAQGTREAMLAGFVLDQLAVPPADAVAALVPLLASDDPARRAGLARVLSQYEDPSLERGSDFSLYRPFLEQEPAPGLVRHLYEADPDAALLALTRARVQAQAELRALLLAGHELADLRWRLLHGFLQEADLPRATAERSASLELLARHPHWWARCAVVQLAREQPGLRALLPLEALAADAHPLVRELARAALEPGR
jgi:hypothetical protein